MIDQKFRVVFQISQPANIPQKRFSTQNASLEVRFKMRLTPTTWAFYLCKNQANTMAQSFEVFLKLLQPSDCIISPEIRSIHGWGLSHLKPNIHWYALSTKSFLRDI